MVQTLILELHEHRCFQNVFAPYCLTVWLAVAGWFEANYLGGSMVAELNRDLFPSSLLVVLTPLPVPVLSLIVVVGGFTLD